MLLCSVVVAAYNVERYVGPAVESALSQTYSEVEVIVVNDGSTDDTGAALEPFRGRIRYVEQPNKGLAAARNRGLREASGEYVAILDADDLWLPNRLERVIGFLEDRPDIGFATSDAFFLSDASSERRRYYDELPGGFRARDQAYWILDYNFILGMAVVRRSLFARYGIFDETLRTSEDWDLWIRFILGGERAGLLDEPLAYYRRRPGALSLDERRIIEDALFIVERAVSRPEVREIPRLGTTLYRRGLQSLAIGDRVRARKFFSIAARDRRSVLGLRAKAAVLAALPGLGSRVSRRAGMRPAPVRVRQPHDQP
jgi:glycosyltransferase involved in cell wall biosynthesis